MYEQDAQERFARARKRMVECDLMGRGMTDSAVLKVMGEVPRENFMPVKYSTEAYADNPMPIGMGQTISQPYIVAMMTQRLHLNRNCQVLEIGTGSGYQTAVLSRLAKKVYTAEKFAQLSESAQSALSRGSVENVEFYIGDGSCGWPKKKLFDRIIVTAAVPRIPQPLIDQLADGGLIVAPVGDRLVQQLVVCEKKSSKLTEKKICDVRFVKLLGKYGFEE